MSRVVLAEKEIERSRELLDALLELLCEAGMDCDVKLLDSGKKLVQLVEVN